MIIVPQSYIIDRWDPEKDLDEICKAARICYKAKNLNNLESKQKFVKALRMSKKKNGDVDSNPHLSPYEHTILSVTFTTNIGISHEIVRHRLASFNQESSRYCTYTKERFGSNVYFIDDTSIPERFRNDWLQDCKLCEDRYFNRIGSGLTTDQARGVLNKDVKTEIKVTANYREWRHIFQLRCDDKHAHYQMVELMTPLLHELKDVIPCVFDDILY